MLNLGLGLILGSILGSLVDCLANRSLSEESFFGRSYCDSCKKTLRWYDLFPILSYIFAGGRCRYCHAKIPYEALLVEILMALLVGGLFYFFAPNNLLSIPPLEMLVVGLSLFFKVFAICIFVIVLLTDLKTGIIPDRITYPAILIAFIWLIVEGVVRVVLFYFSLAQSELGKYLLPPYSDYFYHQALNAANPFIMGLLAAFILAFFFGTLIVVTRGRGMGGGDLKLAIFIGLVFGLPNSVLVIFLSFVLGSIFGLALIAFGRKKFGQTIPFGPFLSASSIIAIFWGSQLIDWYFNLNFLLPFN